MPIEIEAKMAVQDLPGFQAKLESLGAEDRGRVMETNTFFDTTDNQLLSNDHALRLRVRTNKEGDIQAIVTHKGPRAHGPLKSRNEAECVIDSPRDMARVFEGLGYHPRFAFQKMRHQFRLDGCAVELDTLPYLGNFVEIEGETEEAVLALREKLGLSEAPLIRSSYAAMLTTYAHENGMRADVVRFVHPPTL